MSTNPKAQIAASTGTVVSATTAAVTGLTVAAVALGPKVSGSGFTKMGAEKITEAENYVHAVHKEGPSKEEYIVPPNQRRTFQKSRIKPLIERRDDLEKMTETAMGSFKNWIPAIGFYRDAAAVTDDAKRLSDKSLRDYRELEPERLAERGENVPEFDHRRADHRNTSRGMGPSGEGSRPMRNYENMEEDRHEWDRGSTTTQMYPPRPRFPPQDFGHGSSPIYAVGRDGDSKNSGHSPSVIGAGGRSFGRAPSMHTSIGNQDFGPPSVEYAGGNIVGHIPSIPSAGGQNFGHAIPSVKSTDGQVFGRTAASGSRNVQLGHTVQSVGSQDYYVGPASVKSPSSQYSGSTSSVQSVGGPNFGRTSYVQNAGSQDFGHASPVHSVGGHNYGRSLSVNSGGGQYIRNTPSIYSAGSNDFGPSTASGGQNVGHIPSMQSVGSHGSRRSFVESVSAQNFGPPSRKSSVQSAGSQDSHDSGGFPFVKSAGEHNFAPSPSITSSGGQNMRHPSSIGHRSSVRSAGSYDSGRPSVAPIKGPGGETFGDSTSVYGRGSHGSERSSSSTSIDSTSSYYSTAAESCHDSSREE